jgi:hypothetical protein
MVDTRTCDQCGAEFTPQREHGRFCSARCRVAWNRENTGDRATEGSALGWSVAAMRESTARLLRARAWDRARTFTVIGEAVWWVTIVDGTLVKYHPRPYEAVLASQGECERKQIEETMAGLRFVRNQMGLDIDQVGFINGAGGQSGRGADRVTALRWTSLPAPELSALTPRGQAWETARYAAYQAQLAGHTMGETFGRASDFLFMAAEKAALAEVVAVL